MKTTIWIVTLFATLFVIINVEPSRAAKVAHITSDDGNDASPGEFPYFVYIQKKDNRSTLVTGGVLIKSKVVLTTAEHFIGQKAGDFEVVLGTNDRSDLTESTRVVIPVVGYKIHPTFARTRDSGDVALIRLQTEADVDSPNVAVLPMSSIAKPNTNETDLSECVTMGYGLIKKTQYEWIYPNVLQTHTPSVTNDTLCSNILGGGSLDNEWLCTLDDTYNECNGDAGNPLLCYADGKYYIHGLSAFGSQGCDEGFNVWTRVSTYYRWIWRTAVRLQQK